MLGTSWSRKDLADSEPLSIKGYFVARNRKNDESIKTMFWHCIYYISETHKPCGNAVVTTPTKILQLVNKMPLK
jgi:hypothetical protein